MTAATHDARRLFKAVEADDVETVLAALAAGASANEIDDRDEEGCLTALQLAALKGSLEAAKVLLEHGADASAVNRHGETAVYLAALHENDSIVSVLKPLVEKSEAQAEVDRAARDREYRQRIASQDHKQRERFFMALHRGDVEKATRLLASIELNRVETFGDFGLPLLTALELGLENLVPILLEAGADPNVWFDQGPHRASTPLGMAASTPARRVRRRRLAEMLLRHGADVTSRGLNGATPLHEAALFSAGGSGRLDGLEALVRANADLEARDEFTNTPWMLAAWRAARDDWSLPPRRRREAVVAALAKAGADTSHRASVSLLLAAERGEMDMAAAALAAGADPCARTATGSPALFLAVQSNRPDLVRALLDAGADPMVPDPLYGDGTTPLELARRDGLTEIVELLGRT